MSDIFRNTRRTRVEGLSVGQSVIFEDGTEGLVQGVQIIPRLYRDMNGLDGLGLVPGYRVGFKLADGALRQTIYVRGEEIEVLVTVPNTIDGALVSERLEALYWLAEHLERLLFYVEVVVGEDGAPCLAVHSIMGEFVGYAADMDEWTALHGSWLANRYAPSVLPYATGVTTC